MTKIKVKAKSKGSGGRHFEGQWSPCCQYFWHEGKWWGLQIGRFGLVKHVIVENINEESKEEKADETEITLISSNLAREGNKTIVFKAPTGSGKTVMMAEFLKQQGNNDKDKALRGEAALVVSARESVSEEVLIK